MAVVVAYPVAEKDFKLFFKSQIAFFMGMLMAVIVISMMMLVMSMI